MKSRSTERRRGAIAPLTAFLLIPLLGMAAFVIDMGWITHTQNQLQSAADAAALAGAGQLTDSYVAYYLPGVSAAAKQTILSTATATARTYARNFAGYNSAGGVSSLNLLDGDIEFGYTDSSGTYTSLATYTGYPNTCKVVLRRDSSANTPLSLFFAPAIGMSKINLTATASATLHSGTLNGFRTDTSFVSRILPMTYDINQWNDFLTTGKSPDGTTDLGSNGLPQLDVYPSIKFTGNFGELSLDQGNNGASVISNWIDNGVPAADLKADYNAGLLPLSMHNSNSAPDWKGNPGLKTSTIHTTGDHVGETYLMPLFKPVNDGIADPTSYQAGTGQGSNYYYTIVQFVGVKITYVDNKSINVQPTAVIDPNALLTSVSPASPPNPPANRLATVFTAPKLTR